MRITPEFDEERAALVRLALDLHGEALKKAAKKNSQLGVSTAEIRDNLAAIYGRGETPGLLHDLAEWSQVPAPQPEQEDIFGSRAGPWAAEQSVAGFRVRNTLSGEVHIVATAEIARTRAGDLNQSYADRREHDSRSWTGDGGAS
jgi:hypothetical protein